MTDEQIKEFAEKHGRFGVEAWWSMAIPRFRAMLEENAAQQSVQSDLLPCGHSKKNQRWSLPEGVEYCVACAATSR